METKAPKEAHSHSQQSNGALFKYNENGNNNNEKIEEDRQRETLYLGLAKYTNQRFTSRIFTISEHSNSSYAIDIVTFGADIFPVLTKHRLNDKNMIENGKWHFENRDIRQTKNEYANEVRDIQCIEHFAMTFRSCLKTRLTQKKEKKKDNNNDEDDYVKKKEKEKKTSTFSGRRTNFSFDFYFEQKRIAEIVKLNRNFALTSFLLHFFSIPCTLAPCFVSILV